MRINLGIFLLIFLKQVIFFSLDNSSKVKMLLKRARCHRQ